VTGDADGILEWRHYVAAPGCADRLVRRFHAHTFPLFDAHGMRVLAFGRDDEGPGHLHYVLAWRDEEQMRGTWEAFVADARWTRVREVTERDGPLIASIERRVLRALDPALRLSGDD
jgi:hypothetical protein